MAGVDALEVIDDDADVVVNVDVDFDENWWQLVVKKFDFFFTQRNFLAARTVSSQSYRVHEKKT